MIRKLTLHEKNEAIPRLVLARIDPWSINAAGYRLSQPLDHTLLINLTGALYAFKLAAALYYLTGEIYKKPPQVD